MYIILFIFISRPELKIARHIFIFILKRIYLLLLFIENPPVKKEEAKELKPLTPAQKKAKMASIFSVLDDPDFHKPQVKIDRTVLDKA